MNATSRTRYHVGMNEIGLDPEYRIECLPDLEGARAWLTADIENTAEDVEDDTEFDALLAKLYETPDAGIVGEWTCDAFTFWVRAVEDCACPCDCAETDRADECNGTHGREAAPEPKLADPDEQGRSAFQMRGTEYRVFNTAGKPLDGYWAVERVAADGSPLQFPEFVFHGQQTREGAFERAVEKLHPYGVITFLPQRYRTITMDQDDQDADEYPEVTRDGWVCAWSTAGYVVVFEDGTERGIVWPGRPIEAHITGKDGRWVEFDGEWKFWEQAAAAVRAHVIDNRA
ncbi:hypothetical protein PV518_14770 [Streptomyces sp. ND04-05B]|uniref:hypothetical protein n=1 Tax=Streptomyces sp. ND04-05B TaxID=3028693 RepID=UPI0029B14CCA|nr:hypothetical protein [Streptomyces sp. ND04-05B]MDX3063431.1 hypothetical protein [Streptomyces sp. ND04-05B]